MPAGTIPPASPEPALVITNTTSETPTPAVDTPTQIDVTETQTPTASPVFTEIPLVTLPSLPTLFQPTMTYTPMPQPEALTGAIQFLRPGPMSQESSPVFFYGYAVPGFRHKGMMELYGEDGSVLASELIQLNTDYHWAFFSWSLEFTPRGAGELGRLSLSTKDEYGRLTAVGSIHLMLLTAGLDIITPADRLGERCTLSVPIPGKYISGGKVLVEGRMQSYNDQPLVLSLTARDGSILGSVVVPVPSGEAGRAFDFEAEIPYSVRVYTPVLLSVEQLDDKIPGILYLYSQELNLNP